MHMYSGFKYNVRVCVEIKAPFRLATYYDK